ncbi:MAG TPA: acyloxyacyl hydrolase [Ramlibacter sp.]|uniref:acyloxyacyl hydrolase n=1 Tax=Ramlibacter sp. TaxID=1917967 RepID=UPI002BA31203|nr:acyloxyacyl hydrolase [Ramlibacter sp.]HVZ42532.1 acyloxyacyl hydrolase [Ramlibacter sp.]
MKKKAIPLAAAAALCIGAALPARAEGLKPAGWFAELGAGREATESVTLGLTWPWHWRAQFAGGEFTGLTEAYVSGWSAHDFGGGRQTLGQVGVVPIFRLRPAEGRSDWFGEIGIGLSWTSRMFRTPDRQFGSTFNFHDTIGFGYSFGANRSQEVGLRVVHFSNAGFKHPNPGIEFVQLRYASSF